MLDENQIRRRIHQAVDPVVPTAPWLANSIRDSIRVRSQRPSGGLSASKNLAAVILVLALAAALVLGSRALLRSQPTPSHPRVDPAVQHYRTVVDRDFAALQRQIESGMQRTCNEGRIPTCRDQILQTRQTVQSFQADLAETPVPTGLQLARSDLNKGLSDELAVLDAMSADLDGRDFSAYGDDWSRLWFTKLTEVYPAVMAVDCWPAPAVDARDSAGTFRLVCGTAPSSRDGS